MTERKNFKTIDELIGVLGQAAGESPTYQRIAIYIEKNYLRVVFMTANELAEEMGVSQGSVSRFFIALGYHGYNDFLRSLQRIVERQLVHASRGALPADVPEAGHRWQQVLENEAANLRVLAQSLQGPDYEQLTELLASGRKICLLSAQLSATLLPYAAYELRRLGIEVSMAWPGTAEWEWLEQEDPAKTAVLVLGFPRYANALLKKCQNLKRSGFSLAVITDSQFSPFAKLGDPQVLVPLAAGGQDEIYGAPLTFLHLLAQDVIRQLPDGRERLNRISEAERQKRMYFIK